MALLNEILVGRFNAALSRLLGIQGPAPAPQLASDIMPAIILESDRPEYLYLGGQRPWAARGEQPATAAKFGAIQIFNPAGSGVISIVEGLLVDVAAADRILVGWSDTVLTTAGGTIAMLDRRTPGGVAATTTLQMWNDPLVALVGTNWFGIDALAGSPISVYWNGRAAPILNPGTGLIIQASTVNNLLRASIWGRERALFSTET